MLLEVNNLEIGYGTKQVLYKVSIEINKGEIVSLIGPNGAGKSTLLKAICGLIIPWEGEVLYNGSRINDTHPAENIERGIIFCPQGNRVFAQLSVIENLEIGGHFFTKSSLINRLEVVLDSFPVLRNRLSQMAGQLSSGEQQMLALARALVPNPELLLLDEPSLGLAPNLVKSVFQRVVELDDQFAPAVLIVEQKVRQALAISQRVYALRQGKISYCGDSLDLRDNKERLRDLFL